MVGIAGGDGRLQKGPAAEKGGWWQHGCMSLAPLWGTELPLEGWGDTPVSSPPSAVSTHELADGTATTGHAHAYFCLSKYELHCLRGEKQLPNSIIHTTCMATLIPTVPAGSSGLARQWYFLS